MTHADARRLIERQVELGTALGQREAQALRAHLRRCEACRHHYDRAVALERALEGGSTTPKTQADRVVVLGPPKPAAPIGWAPVLVAAAAATVLWLHPWAPKRVAEPPPEALARGGTAEGRRAWVALYTRRGDVVQPADGRLRPGDGILVAYTTLKDSPARHIAVAARSLPPGPVRWLHPAYEAGQRPQSVPIEVGVADRELPAVVYLDGLTPPLEVCAMFTDEPLQIPEIDAVLEQGGPWPAGADCHRLEAAP